MLEGCKCCVMEKVKQGKDIGGLESAAVLNMMDMVGIIDNVRFVHRLEREGH